MALFRYTPLSNPNSDIRLIDIVYGRPDEILICQMRTTYSEISTKYQALSYTWGDATRKVPIKLNGGDFFITKNLENALRQLRTREKYFSVLQTPLWIDAICINQEDSNERDAQVRRMKSIYEQAEQVVIWLGKYNEPTDQAFRPELRRWEIDGVQQNSEDLARCALLLCLCLKEEAARIHKMEFLTRLKYDFAMDLATTSKARNIVNPEAQEISMSLEDCKYASEKQVWAQLSRLFYRPWFERLWIIQELAVSRKTIVLWGGLQMPWSTLEIAAKLILRPKGLVISPQIARILPLLGAHRITQVALQLMYNIDTKNVLTILHNTQNTKCSDARDRLYAIRGIVEDNEDIEIDYSIPVQQVYRNWAMKRIQRTRSLDIFSACADSSRSGDLPSWIPDLRRPFGQDKPLWYATQTLVPCNQSLQFHSRDVQFSGDGLKVRLPGTSIWRINHLTSVGDVATGLQDPLEPGSLLRNIIAEWETTLDAPRRVSGDESLALRGFKQTLLRSFYPHGLGDFSPWSNDSQNLDALAVPYDIWRGNDKSEDVLQRYIDSRQWNMARHEENIREFERSLFPRVHGCQMFTVEAGRTGIVAANCGVRVGDEVWLLQGGLTAFILRRINEEEHRLMSPCYLFGKMHAKDADQAWQPVILV